MTNKKEPLSIIAVKTLLAVIIFAGIGTIIIGGGLLIGERGKISDRKQEVKYCEKDSDCGWGTIQSDPLRFGCKLNGTEKGPSNAKCICDKNFVPPKCKEVIIKEEVTITTDKTEYERGETVEITVKNNLDEKIVLSVGCSGFFLKIQEFSDGEWKQLITSCGVCERELSDLIDLHTLKIYNWNQQTFTDIGDCNSLEQVLSGRYKVMVYYMVGGKFVKTVYSNEFTIKEKSAFDARCSEKVKFSGYCEIASIGIEFDSNKGKCVIKYGSCHVESPFKTLEECQEVCEKNNRKVKYQIFSTSLGTSDKEEMIDYAYIYKDDKLPKTIELEDNVITIQKIEIQKTGGFMAYATIATILYNDKEKKIGFWHPDGKIQNKENGCLDKDNKQVCGGGLAMNIKEWTEESTKEEKEKGILSATYLKRFSLQEIDYDFNSDDWNYVKIILSLYREPNYPITTF